MKPQKQGYDWHEAAQGLPRVAAPCPHFGMCGGCQLQDLAYSDQVSLKEGRLRSLFGDPALTPSRWLPPITGPEFGYRLRLRFSVRFVPKKGGALVGFREKKKTYVVDMHHCPILPKRVSDLIDPLRELVARLSQPKSIAQISVSAADSHDAYVIRNLEPLTGADLILLREFEETRKVRFYLQSGGYETLEPMSPGTPARLTYRLEDQGLSLSYRPHHFTQVNADVNRAMVRQALELLAIRRGEKGLDLFCGVGNFTLAFARQGAEVLGVDSDGDQIGAARDNAILNKLEGSARFEAGDLYRPEGVATVPFNGRSFIVLDPPRTGAEEVCRALDPGGAERLLYISCNPESLARDAAILVGEKGYQLRALGLVDMFPQTVQAEAMALFQRQ